MNVWEQRQIIVRKARLAVYYSPFIRDSITFLDLNIGEYSLFQRRSLEGNRKWAFLWKTFIRSKEDGNRVWSDRSRVMYRLHLDTPNQVVGRIRRHSGGFLGQSHDLTPSRMVFDESIFLEYLFTSVRENLEKAAEKPDFIRKHLRSVKFLFGEHDAWCQILWRYFLYILFGEKCENTEIVVELVKSMPFWKWILGEELDVLKYLLRHAGYYILNGLETHLEEDLINYLVFNRQFEVALLIFEYTDMPHYDATKKTYINTLNRVATLFSVTANELKIPVFSGQLTARRNFQMLQLFQIYMNCHPELQPRNENPQQGIRSLASEALDLIWRSIPDSCFSLGEMMAVYSEVFGINRLRRIHNFYISVVGVYDHVKPLRLLCRVVIRKRMRENGRLPEGINELAVSAVEKAFLRLV